MTRKSTFLLVLVSLPFLVCAQKKSYFNPSLLVLNKGFGASISGGYKPSKYFGIGAGIDLLGDSEERLLNEGFAKLFIETRFFLPSKGRILPTLSANYGSAIYGSRLTTNYSAYVSKLNTMDGLGSFGFSAGVVFLNAKKSRGLYIGVIYNMVRFDESNTTYTKVYDFNRKYQYTNRESYSYKNREDFAALALGISF